MSTAYGSSPMRPASTSALMSRSESSMPGHYRGRQQLAATRDLKPVVTDGYDRALTNPDHFARFAARRHPVGRRHCRAVRRSAVDDIYPTGVQPNRQMGLRHGTRLISDLDQLGILLAGLRLRVTAQQDESVQGDPPPVIQQDRPFLEVRRTLGDGGLVGEIARRIVRQRLVRRSTRRSTGLLLRHLAAVLIWRIELGARVDRLVLLLRGVLLRRSIRRAWVRRRVRIAAVRAARPTLRHGGSPGVRRGWTRRVPHPRRWSQLRSEEHTS